MSNATGKKVRRRAAGAHEVGAEGAVERAVKTMEPALRSEYLKLKKMLASAEKQDAQVRYEIGRVVAKVRGAGPRYGSNAVGQLERALGLDENTLRRYERIANTWTSARFSELMKRTNLYGRPLSWSHLDVLAEVADAKKREVLLDEALREGLSVRALASRVRGPTPALVEDTNESGLNRLLLSAVRVMTARAETVVESVSIWEKSIFERLQKENSPELSESLQNAKGVYTQLRSAVDVILGRIDEGLAAADATRPR
ncbi:MAG TPA: hypothetical protein VE057_28710 [Archangium sp.]|nr:hypothetical protein [Archangium sp.]